MAEGPSGKLARAEKSLERRFHWLIYSSLAITLLILLGLIAGIYFDVYYKGADGLSYLLGFAAWSGALVFKAWLDPVVKQEHGHMRLHIHIEREPPQVVIRIVSYAITIAFLVIYLAVQVLLLVRQCNDPTFLSTHPVENYICTTGYPALIASIVYVSVFIAIFIVLIVIDALILRAARKYVKIRSKSV